VVVVELVEDADVGVGWSPAQADIAAIAAKASVAALIRLVFVICGSPRDLNRLRTSVVSRRSD